MAQILRFLRAGDSHRHDVVPPIVDLIGAHGLGSLVLRFAASGMGPQVESWIRCGPNQRITARQVRAAVGADEIDQIAAQSALDPKQVAQGLAWWLPRAIDRLTPDGTVPTSASLRRTLGHLDGLLEAS